MKKGYVVWLTGLPCSGKTTIAEELVENTRVNYENPVLLDGDSLRFEGKPITGITGFSIEEREDHLMRVASIANYLAEIEGKNVICSFVSPSEEVRQNIKSMLRYMYLVHVNCSKKICAARDVKDMWRKAKEGEIMGFTGYDAPYDIPKNPDLTVDSENTTVEECVNKIVIMLNEKHRRDMFIGRWQAPGVLHEGHKTLIDTSLKAGKPVTIFVREMIPEKNNNPHRAYDIKSSIEETYAGEDVEVMVGDNIGAICYGRGVGYEIKEVSLDKETEQISATKLRKEKDKKVKKEECYKSMFRSDEDFELVNTFRDYDAEDPIDSLFPEILEKFPEIKRVPSDKRFLIVKDEDGKWETVKRFKGKIFSSRKSLEEFLEFLIQETNNVYVRGCFKAQVSPEEYKYQLSYLASNKDGELD